METNKLTSTDSSETWNDYISKLVPMKIDLVDIIDQTMKAKINNNWSRKRKNAVSKPLRRKLRQVKKLLIDTIVTNVTMPDEEFDRLSAALNEPLENKALTELLARPKRWEN